MTPEQAESAKLLSALKAFYRELARDPMSKEGAIMTDPVIAPDGVCYEKAKLETLHHTPSGVALPEDPAERALVLIPNSKLKREIKKIQEIDTPDASEETLLTAYLDFYCTLSESYATLSLMNDPAVIGVRHAADNSVRVEGNVISVSDREEEIRAGLNKNPASGAYLDLETETILPWLIVYVKHQEAVLLLKEQVNTLNLSLFPDKLQTLLKEIKEYRPFHFEPVAPHSLTENTRVHIQRRVDENAFIYLMGQMPLPLHQFYPLPYNHSGKLVIYLLYHLFLLLFISGLASLARPFTRCAYPNIASRADEDPRIVVTSSTAGLFVTVAVFFPLALYLNFMIAAETSVEVTAWAVFKYMLAINFTAMGATLIGMKVDQASYMQSVRSEMYPPPASVERPLLWKATERIPSEPDVELGEVHTTPATRESSNLLLSQK